MTEDGVGFSWYRRTGSGWREGRVATSSTFTYLAVFVGFRDILEYLG
jgi:hypothetical protein